MYVELARQCADRPTLGMVGLKISASSSREIITATTCSGDGAHPLHCHKRNCAHAGSTSPQKAHRDSTGSSETPAPVCVTLEASSLASLAVPLVTIGVDTLRATAL
jgi:hypothetical protein